MKIGRNKILAAVGALAASASGLVGWLIGGTTGLLVVTLGMVVASTGALGAFVALSERRVRRLMTEHHRADTRAVAELARETTEMKAMLAAAGHTGKHAEDLLRAVQASFTRMDHESQEQHRAAASAVVAAVRDEFETIARQFAATRAEFEQRIATVSTEIDTVTREVDTLAREVGVSRREVVMAGREVADANERLIATTNGIQELTDASRISYERLRQDVLDELSRRSRREVVANFRRLVDEAVSEFDALQQLHARFPVPDPPPPLGGWAIGPGALLYVLDHVASADVDLVVECGPGASTIYLAEYFRQRGRGRIVSMEHDHAFFESVTADLRRRGLDTIAEVRHAPIVEVAVGDERLPWYDPDVVADVSGIDLLLVDGPPQATGPAARYPAVPLLAARLAPNARIVLDDAHRPGEQAAIARWRDELGWRELITRPGGFAALERPVSVEATDEADDPGPEDVARTAAADPIDAAQAPDTALDDAPPSPVES